jgi:hypothetical protein
MTKFKSRILQRYTRNDTIDAEEFDIAGSSTLVCKNKVARAFAFCGWQLNLLHAWRHDSTMALLEGYDKTSLKITQAAAQQNYK